MLLTTEHFKDTSVCFLIVIYYKQENATATISVFKTSRVQSWNTFRTHIHWDLLLVMARDWLTWRNNIERKHSESQEKKQHSFHAIQWKNLTHGWSSPTSLCLFLSHSWQFNIPWGLYWSEQINLRCVRAFVLTHLHNVSCK